MDAITLNDLRLNLLEGQEKPEAAGGFIRRLRSSRRGPLQVEDTEHLRGSQQPSAREQEPEGQEEVKKVSPLEPSAMMSEVFEPLKPLQEKLAQLSKVLEPIAQAQQLPETFDSIRAFKDKLATVVAPLSNLEQEVEQLAHLFEPMRTFRDQIIETKGAFAGKTAELIRALEPLNRQRMQLKALADALDPVTKLYDDFSGLSEAFTKTAAAAETTAEIKSE